MEREAWWVTGTRTEAERHELSGQKMPQNRLDDGREFMTAAGRMENPT